MTLSDIAKSYTMFPMTCKKASKINLRNEPSSGGTFKQYTEFDRHYVKEV